MSVLTFSTWSAVLSQASSILRSRLVKEIRAACSHAFDATIASRGKPKEFWIPYVEEWKEPPLERAKRSLDKTSFYNFLAYPWVRRLLLRTFLSPVAFLPFATSIAMAFLSSLTSARRLQEPYFDLKGMTPFERELFMVERQWEFRLFGFFAALLERIPILGLVFCISNRIAVAMWAHDEEKVQVSLSLSVHSSES